MRNAFDGGWGGRLILRENQGLLLTFLLWSFMFLSLLSSKAKAVLSLRLRQETLLSSSHLQSKRNRGKAICPWKRGRKTSCFTQRLAPSRRKGRNTNHLTKREEQEHYTFPRPGTKTSKVQPLRLRHSGLRLWLVQGNLSTASIMRFAWIQISGTIPI